MLLHPLIDSCLNLFTNDITQITEQKIFIKVLSFWRHFKDEGYYEHRFKTSPAQLIFISTITNIIKKS